MKNERSPEETISALNKKMDFFSRLTLLWAVSFLALLIIGIVLLFCGEPATALSFLIPSILVCFIAPILNKAKANIEDKISAQRQIISNRRAEAEHQRRLAGEWEFPAEEFYNRCLVAGIASLTADDNVSMTIACAVAETLVDKPYHAVYITPEKLVTYFTKGAKAAEKRTYSLG